VTPRSIGSCLAVVLTLALGGVCADAADTPDPAAFLHTTWNTADGLPQNSINAILQSRDGYLWLGTFGGLVRFDGVAFTVFNDDPVCVELLLSHSADPTAIDADGWTAGRIAAKKGHARIARLLAYNAGEAIRD
jgi:hypothetical protein